MGDAAALAVEMAVGTRDALPTPDEFAGCVDCRYFVSGGALAPGAGTCIRTPLPADQQG